MPAYLREVLPRAPIRLLYDLHRTARDYPAEVEAYVGAWDESGATLAEGARFIAGLKSKTDVPSIEAAPMQAAAVTVAARSEEHTSELQSLMRISYAVFCLKKKKQKMKKIDITSSVN